MRLFHFLTSALLLLILFNCTMNSDKSSLGIFRESGDVGPVTNTGEAIYNPEDEVYSVKGSGTNMWFNNDEFYFVWRIMTGNVILSTQIEFIGKGVEPHRKAGLIVRESLDPGSPYVSAACHGDGLISMQYRTLKDSATSEFRAADDSLSMLRLIIHSDTVTMQAAAEGDVLREVGKLAVDFIGDKEYYIGLFVCSHNPDVIEEALFHNTRLSIPAKNDFVPYTDYIGSRLEVLDIRTGDRKIIFESELPIEAPNWSRDGKYFIVNAGGLIYRISADGRKIKKINTGFATSNNNDHGLSPDGKRLVISNHASDRPESENSVIYILPAAGSKPRQVTQYSPSYWHGWSPDGKYLIYTGKRKNEWNIYKIAAEGGHEIQLTHTSTLDDGSEFSADGRSIWFNSNRTGTMEIWKMREDGSGQVQITDDKYQNWFPHESPKGDKLVFLSYLPGVNAWDHPYYKQVMLRMIDLNDGIPAGRPRVVAWLYGGQGTINVHSWSPDGTKLAFVSNSAVIDY